MLEDGSATLNQMAKMLVYALAGATGLAAEPVVAQTEEARTDEPEIIVTGIASNFRVTETSSALRFPADTLDIPQSVSVITQDLLELANVADLGESAIIMGGVTYGGRNFARPQFNFRGFEGGVDGSVRTDLYPSNLYFLPDIVLVEQIDVIKGPVSVVYGQLPPGGTINLVTKQPERRTGARIRLLGASFDRFRAEADINLVLDQGGKARLRLVGAYENTGSFVDFANEETRVIGGSFVFEPSEAVTLRLKGFWQDRNARYDVGGSVFAATGEIPDVPRSRFHGQPWNRSEFTFGNAGARVTWHASERIDLNAIFDYQYNSRYNLFAQLNGPLDAEGTARLVRREDAEGVSDNYVAELNATGRFVAFGGEHAFLAGFTYFNGRDTDVDHQRITLPGRFSVFEPDYSFDDPGARLQSIRIGKTESIALSGQTLLSLSDRVKLMVGGRYTDDTVNVPLFACGTPTAPTLCPLGANRQDLQLVEVPAAGVDAGAREFVPMGGLTYRVVPRVNLYVNWARSFQLQSGRTVEGALIPPSEGRQFEAGAKADLVPNQLAATVAVYEIRRTNLQQNDEENPGFFIVTGEQRSRGVELELAGRILPGWSMVGQYTFIDAKITQDQRFAGLRPPRVPRHSGSLFTTYELQSGPARGLGFGAGFIYVGARPATQANLFDQPAYTTVDLQTFYNLGPWELLASVSNLFDERYYNVTFDGSPNGVLPGAPRTLRLSVARRF